MNSISLNSTAQALIDTTTKFIPIMPCIVCNAPVPEIHSCRLPCNSVAHIKCIDNFFLFNKHERKFKCAGCGEGIDYFEFLGSILNNKVIPEGMTCQVERFRSLPQNVSILNYTKNREITENGLISLLVLKFPMLEFILNPNLLSLEVIFQPNNLSVFVKNYPNSRVKEHQCVYFMLYLCARYDYYVVVKFIVDEGLVQVDDTCSLGSTAMQCAIRGHNIRIVEYLLEKGAKIDFKSHGKDFGNPLYTAISVDDPQITKILLKAGANPNIYLNGKDNCLFRACNLKRPDCLQLLLDHGVKNSFCRISQMSAVHICISDVKVDYLKLLVRQGGFDFNDQNGNQKYLMHLAASRGNPEIIEFLIECGANIYETMTLESYNNLKWTCPYLDVDVLINNPAAVISCTLNHLDGMRVFLNHGFDPNFRIFDGKSTLLHLACKAKKVEMAILLIKFGADTNAIVENESTSISPLYPYPDLLSQVLNHNYIVIS